MMIETILFVFICIFFPLLLILLSGKFSIFKLISPIVWCYLVGIFLGNMPFFSLPTQLVQNISQFSVLLAIPLLLVSTNIALLKLQARKGLLCFLMMVLSVLASSILVGFLFIGSSNTPEIVGMLTGILIGGTPNMASVYLALQLPEALYISLSTVQIALGGVYLLYVSMFAKPLYWLFLPKNIPQKNIGSPFLETKVAVPQLIIGLGKSLFLSLSILGISVFLVQSIFGKMNEIWLILLLTSFSFLASMSPRLRRTPFAFDLGNYLLLVFSLAIGYMAKISTLFASAGELVLITGSIMVLALFFHLVLSYIFKIDAETVIISSVAAFFGPAFIVQVATAIDSRSLIALGIACGILGYALGTYLGLGVSFLLKYIA